MFLFNCQICTWVKLPIPVQDEIWSVVRMVSVKSFWPLEQTSCFALPQAYLFPYLFYFVCISIYFVFIKVCSIVPTVMFAWFYFEREFWTQKKYPAVTRDRAEYSLVMLQLCKNNFIPHLQTEHDSRTPEEFKQKRQAPQMCLSRQKHTKGIDHWLITPEVTHDNVWWSQQVFVKRKNGEISTSTVKNRYTVHKSSL